MIYLWNLEEENDNNDNEDQGKGCIRSKNDVRILYEAWPDNMNGKRLGHLAAKYRETQAGGHGLARAQGKIDLGTGVRPDSDARVIGEDNLAAPTCIRISNGTVMQRRVEKLAVLHLLYSRASGRFGHEMLWHQWQFLEHVRGNQGDDESVQKKNLRLAIFPLSMYQTSVNDEENWVSRSMIDRITYFHDFFRCKLQKRFMHKFWFRWSIGASPLPREPNHSIPWETLATFYNEVCLGAFSYSTLLIFPQWNPTARRPNWIKIYIFAQIQMKWLFKPQLKNIRSPNVVSWQFVEEKVKTVQCVWAPVLKKECISKSVSMTQFAFCTWCG